MFSCLLIISLHIVNLSMSLFPLILFPPISSKRGGKQWQTTPKNLPRMQCARAIPVTWLGSGSCQARPSRLNTNEWRSNLMALRFYRLQGCPERNSSVDTVKQRSHRSCASYVATHAVRVCLCVFFPHSNRFAVCSSFRCIFAAIPKPATNMKFKASLPGDP